MRGNRVSALDAARSAEGPHRRGERRTDGADRAAGSREAAEFLLECKTVLTDAFGVRTFPPLFSGDQLDEG